MTEKDIHMLLSLYETRNITRTANDFFMTQPAMTKRLQNLEEDLGDTLLIRSRTGLAFTTAGEKAIRHFRIITKELQELRDEIQAEKGFLGGNLKIGASYNYAHYRLPEILKKFTHCYPHVDIHLQTDWSLKLTELLRQDQIYLAIVRGELEWDEGKVLIDQEPMCLIYSRENHGRPLRDFPFILRQSDSVFHEQMKRWLSEHELTNDNARLHINNIDACVSMAECGLGWSVVPKICLDRFQGYAEPLFFADGTPFVRNTYVFYKNSFSRLPQVKKFLEYLQQIQKGKESK